MIKNNAKGEQKEKRRRGSDVIIPAEEEERENVFWTESIKGPTVPIGTLMEKEISTMAREGSNNPFFVFFY